MYNKNKPVLVLLPFAGGNAYSYRCMLNNLQINYEVLTPELPGRGALSYLPLVDDIHELAHYLMEQVIKPIDICKEVVLYGHSMGGLLVYSLTQQMAQIGLNLPRHLVISGCKAPFLKREKNIHAYSSAEFWQSIQEMGGSPKELLEHEELQAYFEPIIRNDFKLVETYNYTKPNDILDLPMTVFYGDQDAMTKESVEAWQQENKQSIKFLEKKGNHFFIFDHVAEITNYINMLAGR